MERPPDFDWQSGEPDLEAERQKASKARKPNGDTQWIDPVDIALLSGTHWLTRDVSVSGPPSAGRLRGAKPACRRARPASFGSA